VIMYPGGYDDMVLAKMQIRSSIEKDNAQREKRSRSSIFLSRASLPARAPRR